jgi:pimeloyl-ACP methyl ester carboxylesterase
MVQRFLDIDGHRVEVLSGNADQGGTPVVFLHGITLSAAFWLPHLPEVVQTTHPWAALTLPGHPPSMLPEGYPARDLRPEMLVAVTQQALMRLWGDRPVILVGYSTGGFVALAVAAQVPRQVQAVAVLAGFAHGRWYGPVGWAQDQAADPVRGTQVFRTAWGLMRRLPLLYTSTCAFMANDLRRLACANWKAGWPSLRENVRQQDPEAMQALFARFRSADIRHQLLHVDVPVLLMAGDRDPVILLHHAYEMATLLPYCELVVLRGCGHLLHYERAMQYRQVMNEWLTRQSARSQPSASLAAVSSQAA